MHAALASAEAIHTRYGWRLTQSQAESMRPIVLQGLEFHDRINAVDPWRGYLTIETETNTVVGGCGFKGNPSNDDQGVAFVEIAYYTSPEYEGRGFATDTAREMVAIARQKHPEVSCVLAHTLRERNASCRVLEKNGFEHLGVVTDPEDGQVWRWRLELTTPIDGTRL